MHPKRTEEKGRSKKVWLNESGFAHCLAMPVPRSPSSLPLLNASPSSPFHDIAPASLPPFPPSLPSLLSLPLPPSAHLLVLVQTRRGAAPFRGSE